MSTSIDPSSAAGARFVELNDRESLFPSGGSTLARDGGDAGDGFDLPGNPPPVYFESGGAPAPSPSPAPAQTLPTTPPIPPEPAVNPLTQGPPPAPAPGPSRLPEVPNPHPYAERTPGGAIVGIKGKF